MTMHSAFERMTVIANPHRGRVFVAWAAGPVSGTLDLNAAEAAAIGAAGRDLKAPEQEASSTPAASRSPESDVADLAARIVRGWTEGKAREIRALRRELDAVAGQRDAAAGALERMHARIRRDLPGEGHEVPEPDDPYWARVLADLVAFADEVYFPLADRQEDPGSSAPAGTGSRFPDGAGEG